MKMSVFWDLEPWKFTDASEVLTASIIVRMMEEE
jgi:hypothetical protein